MKTIITVCFLLFSFLLVGFAESTNSQDATIIRFDKADADLKSIFQNLIAEIKQKHKNVPFLNKWV